MVVINFEFGLNFMKAISSNYKLIRELIFCGLLAFVKSASAQSEEDYVDTNFRVKLDYVAISSVFNQQNIREIGRAHV